MGAWGVGVFEDDTGCDVLDDIAEASNPRAELERRLRHVAEMARLEYTDAFDALVPATIVDAYVNGTACKGLDDFHARHPDMDLRSLVSVAARAVDRVLDPKVELHQLWAENEDDYPRWRSSLEALRARLLSK